MKSAKKMFEELGYKRAYKDDDRILYRKFIEKVAKTDFDGMPIIIKGEFKKINVYREIEFIEQRDNVSISYSKKGYSQFGPPIDMLELKAIEQQFKEICIAGGGTWEY